MRLPVAWLLLGLSGVSYSNPTWAQLGPGGPLAVDPTGAAEPRFVVRAVSFQPLDETGWDWTGSDEVVFTFRTPQYVLVTSKYGNIDSDGDAHIFDAKENCIVPAVDDARDGYPNGIWQCSDEGVPAPISFVVGAYEQDPDRLAAILDLITGIFGGQPFEGDDMRRGTDVRHPLTFLRQTHWPNHLIGKTRAQLSLADLLEQLPEVGRKYTRNVVLKGACDRSESDAPCDEDEPLYDVIYEITRVNDATAVGPHP